MSPEKATGIFQRKGRERIHIKKTTQLRTENNVFGGNTTFANPFSSWFFDQNIKGFRNQLTAVLMKKLVTSLTYCRTLYAFFVFLNFNIACSTIMHRRGIIIARRHHCSHCHSGGHRRGPVLSEGHAGAGRQVGAGGQSSAGWR